MMKRPGVWTRREFSMGFTSILGMTCLSAEARALNYSVWTASGFAYVGSMRKSGEGAIDVFDVTEDRWKHLQTIQMTAPAHLERHPSLPAIYVLHAVDVWEHLPRGTVSAYSIDQDTGRLKLLNTQPLSLSATSPRHAAVSQNGKYLIVAAERGGSYNLLPIAEDGSLMTPASVRKELGLIEGQVRKTAHPQQVLRHPDGQTILTTDTGSEEIRSFRIKDGLLQLRHCLRVHPGAGASRIAVSRNGIWLYTMHAEDGSLGVHGLDSSTGQITVAQQAVKTDRPEARVMAIHPSGRFLVTAGAERSTTALTTYEADSQSGSLRMVSRSPQHEVIRALAFSSDGQRLVSIGSDSGQIYQSHFDVESGILDGGTVVFQTDLSSCLLLHSV